VLTPSQGTPSVLRAFDQNRIRKALFSNPFSSDRSDSILTPQLIQYGTIDNVKFGPPQRAERWEAKLASMAARLPPGEVVKRIIEANQLARSDFEQTKAIADAQPSAVQGAEEDVAVEAGQEDGDVHMSDAPATTGVSGKDDAAVPDPEEAKRLQAAFDEWLASDSDEVQRQQAEFREWIFGDDWFD